MSRLSAISFRRFSGVVAPDLSHLQNPFGARLSDLVAVVRDRNVGGSQILSMLGGVQGLCDKLQVSPKTGISESSHEDRKLVFGENVVPSAKAKSFLQLVWEALQDIILVILIVAGVLELVLGLTIEEDPTIGWIDGAAIMVSVLIVVLVTAVNDMQKEKQFQALHRKQDKQRLANVIRAGSRLEVSVFDLLVGDIVFLNAGAIIPADGILVDCSNLVTDESALTGESKDITKWADKAPYLLSGTSVKQGKGTMLVLCVGLFSEEGIITKLITGVGKEETTRLEAVDKHFAGGRAVKGRKSATSLLLVPILTSNPILDDVDEEDANKAQAAKSRMDASSSKKKESVLQSKLTKMAILIGKFGLAAAVATLLVLLGRYFIEDFGIEGEAWRAKRFGDLLEFLTIAVTVVVVAVPEGLPLAVTIALAYSVNRMMKDNNLVRVLSACETMGNATTICSDKTGTLTKNKMTVVAAWAGGKTFDTSTAQLLEAVSAACHADVKAAIAENAAWNSLGESSYSYDAHKQLIQQGNKTESACVFFADGLSGDSHLQLRQQLPYSEHVKCYPFDSAKKRMTTVVPRPGGGFRVYVKGASEIVLGMCTSYLAQDGKVVEMVDGDRARLTAEVIVAFAERALRVILLAHRDFDEPQDWENEEQLLELLTATVFVGIQDPVRDEVPAAVRTCQSAGVTVRMVTGDNVVTARAIAVNCGILNPAEDFLVMEGPEFRRLILKSDGSIDQAALDSIWPRLRVLARCSPSDKYHLVKGLIKAKQVVAVTGDGTNDGPALSEADVGFAMGIAGTGVAKQASDIIITDDNFSSLVKAISWGRNVYDSISKFLVFQLTVNVVAVVVAFVGACILRESPLSAVQLLWVNLIMDSFASLALSTEPPTPALLDRAPYGRNQPLVSRIMARQILGHSAFQLVVLFVVVFAGDRLFDIESGRGLESDHPPTEHYTIVFNVFVLLQLFNEINARKIADELNVFKGFFNNGIFLAVIVGTLAVQVVIVEFGGRAFRTSGLSLVQWAICVGIGATSLVWNVILHFIPASLLPAEWFLGADAAEDDMSVVDASSEFEARVLAPDTFSKAPDPLPLDASFGFGNELPITINRLLVAEPPLAR